MQEYDAITPEEAGRILSNQRWGNRDEAHDRGNAEPAPTTDGQYYGKEAVERGQGYEPMHPAKQTDEVESSVVSEILRQDRAPQEIAAPGVIDYRENGDGSKPLPANQTVDAKQAASDLSRWRENIGEQIEALEAQQIADAIDHLRAGDQQTQQVPEGPIALDRQVQPELRLNDVAAEQQQATQPEINQAPSADDEVVKLLQSNPKLLEAINKEVGQHAAQAELARQAYAQAVTYNAQSALANLTAAVPELRGLNTQEQIFAAVNAIGHTNPARRQEILQYFDRVRSLTAEAQASRLLSSRPWRSNKRRNKHRPASSSTLPLVMLILILTHTPKARCRPTNIERSKQRRAICSTTMVYRSRKLLGSTTTIGR
jgi:hypothetical protein